MFCELRIVENNCFKICTVQSKSLKVITLLKSKAAYKMSIITISKYTNIHTFF